jgi:hypothetical protein
MSALREYQRSKAADLLSAAYEWFSPYTDKRCQFCESELGEPHTFSCPYPQWVIEVRQVLGVSPMSKV